MSDSVLSLRTRVVSDRMLLISGNLYSSEGACLARLLQIVIHASNSNQCKEGDIAGYFLRVAGKGLSEEGTFVLTPI